MKRFQSSLLLASLFVILCACGEPSCPAGSVEMGRRCEPILPDSSTFPAEPDAAVFEDAQDVAPDESPERDSSVEVRPGEAGCTSDDACRHRAEAPHCETRASSEHSGECVACTEHAHCSLSADGAFCVDAACVACRTNADCADPTLPQCNASGSCVACTSDDACAGRDGAAYCAREGARAGECVECLMNEHCEDPAAPECKTNGACAPCISDDACEGRTGLTHCHRRPGTPTWGQCVQCTGDTESADCDGHSCKQATGECTTTRLASRSPCQSCEADSECIEGAGCFFQTFNTTPLGNFCLYRESTHGGCADMQTEARPYRLKQYGISVDGSDSEPYCAPVTSCQAIDDASTSVGPGMLSCTTDDDCGVADLNDGLCGPNGLCNYACDSAYDCPSDIGSCKLPGDGGPKLCSR